MTKLVIDMSSLREQRILFDGLRHLQGHYRFQWCRHRQRRSDRQNRRYWPAIVEPFAEWLSEQQGESVGAEQAHQILKDTLIRVPITNQHGEPIFDRNGNPLMRTQSTTELDTEEFSKYTDDCEHLITELCNITVPRERKTF